MNNKLNYIIDRTINTNKLKKINPVKYPWKEIVMSVFYILTAWISLAMNIVCELVSNVQKKLLFCWFSKFSMHDKHMKKSGCRILLSAAFYFIFSATSNRWFLYCSIFQAQPLCLYSATLNLCAHIFQHF